MLITEKHIAAVNCKGCVQISKLMKQLRRSHKTSGCFRLQSFSPFHKDGANGTLYLGNLHQRTISGNYILRDEDKLRCKFKFRKSNILLLGLLQ